MTVVELHYRTASTQVSTVFQTETPESKWDHEGNSEAAGPDSEDSFSETADEGAALAVSIPIHAQSGTLIFIRHRDGSH